MVRGAIAARAAPALALVLAAAGVGSFVGRAPPTFAALPTVVRCGIEREPVKTLADRLGRGFPLGRVRTASIRQLGQAPVRRGTLVARGLVVERTIYRVSARIVAAKQEEDEDIHLVLADPRTGATMIAELPALACTRGATPRARRLLQAARAAFVRACGLPGAYSFTTYRRATATVTGVGFFDVIHGQRGVAPNGIELHPVLALHAVGCR